MNKTLIVAAVSALAAGGALAQSSVTIYGRLNVTAEQEKYGSSTKIKKLDNNASRIGFKGSEDLGGGLKAGFQLESGVSADTGAAGSPFWGRQSEVNLGGGFGTVRLGNFTSEAYFATADYVSMHNHDTGNSEDKLYAYVGRNTNKIAYRLPTFVKGMSLEGAVSAAESAALKRSYDFAWNYAIGAVQLGAGYEKNNTAKQFAVRGLVELGSFVFGGYVQRDTNGYGTGLGDRTTFRLSGAYNFGANELHLNFGSAGKYSNVANSKAKQFTVAYNYNLSKRTKVYTYFTKVDNNALGYGPNSGGTGAVGSSSRFDFSSIAFGLRHNF